MKGLIFTYVMTYGGAAFALFNPFVGLLIYVSFALIKPESLWHWSVPEGNYSRIVAIGLLAGWAVNGFGSFRFGRARLILLAAIGYLIWTAVCAVGALDQDKAWGQVEELAKVVLPVLVGASLIDSTKKLRQLAWVIVVSQGYLAFEFNLSYWEGSNRLVTSGFAGMEEKSTAVSMILSAAMAFFLGLSAKRWWLKTLAFGSAALMIHVPLFCFSRGGMLGLIATAVVAFVLIPKKPVYYLAFSTMIAVGLRLVGPEVREEFMTTFADSSQRDASAQNRIDYWSRCWDTMLRYPLTGIGTRSWVAWVKTQPGWQTTQEAHQTWLQTGAELGFPGLILLGSFYGACMAMLWPLTRVRYAHVGPEAQNFARMVISALIGFIVASQFITLYGIETPFYVTLIGIGLLKVTSVYSGSDENSAYSEYPSAAELSTSGDDNGAALCRSS